MLKINEHFLSKLLILFFTMFIFFSSLSYFAVKSIVVSGHKVALKNAIEIISLEIDSIKDLNTFAYDITKKSAISVAIFTLDGNVLADSNSDRSMVKNYTDTEEFMQEQSHKYGDSLRFSKKLKVDLLYVVKRISYKGKDVYLRLAMPLLTLMSTFYTTLLVLFVMFSIGFVVVVYVLKELNKNLSDEVEQLKKYLESIAAKDYEAILHIKHFHEFLELSLILKNIIKRLHKKDTKEK